MKSKILRVLLESEGYVSGQRLCERFFVSRTAVWKVINQLKEEGYEIESVTNKGYRLLTCPDSVTKEAIESQIASEVFGRHVVYFETVGSTNTEAKKWAEQENAHGTLITADYQETGKGRRGKGWISPKFQNIFMTLILKPQIAPVHASMLTLVSAIAVTEAVRELTGMEAMIKWPNDIVLHGKKLCGILTEMSSETDFIHYIIVGIGINVNTEEFSEDIRNMATSLFYESKKKWNRSRLICLVMEKMECIYQIFIQTESMKELKERYDGYLISKGKEVNVIGGTSDLKGSALGINDSGELLVKTETEIIPVIAGEVSVRGLYGYV